MKFLILFAIILFSNITYASELKWNCQKLNLQFIESPGEKGTEFSVEGCWQESTFFLVSADCKKDPKSCLHQANICLQA